MIPRQIPQYFLNALERLSHDKDFRPALNSVNPENMHPIHEAQPKNDNGELLIFGHNEKLLSQIDKLLPEYEDSRLIFKTMDEYVNYRNISVSLTRKHS